MQHVLQDLTSVNIPELIDASQIAYATFRSTFPGGMLRDEAGLLWFETGVPLSIFNGVLRTQLEAEKLSAVVDRVIAHFQRRQLPFEWNVGPTSWTQDLNQILLDHGMVHEEDEPGMAADLHALHEEAADVPNLLIQEVTSDEQLRQWSRTWGCGASVEVGEHWYTLYKGLKLNQESPVHFYLGLLSGEPVATVALFFAEGVAAIHHIVTTHNVRRMGIGAAITLRAAQEARRHGYHIAILTASSLGINIYRRLGFREYCTFSTYGWEPSAN
jgi:GNAT superfamily N-acetyltransferase